MSTTVHFIKLPRLGLFNLTEIRTVLLSYDLRNLNKEKYCQSRIIIFGVPYSFLDLFIFQAIFFFYIHTYLSIYIFSFRKQSI